MTTHDPIKIKISENEAREIESLYDGFLEKLKGLSTENLEKTFTDLVDSAIERLSSSESPLLLYTSKIFDKDYIFAHSLNVCLISIRMGLRTGFDKERLKNLGFSALTHARGDIKIPEELLKRIKHDKESDELIKLADVYDALTHAPSYRHTITPSEALSSLINTDKFFDRHLIKILLEEISLYPRGSWVQLSTNEIGKVIKVNREMPLRPVVEVFIDWDGKHLGEPKRVDLFEKKAIHVFRPLTEEEAKRISEK